MTVDVEATAPSIVVVRTTYDEGWTATVDGRPADVVPVDGFLQGVAVRAGTHEVQLAYRDAAVSRGVTAGLVAWGGLAIAFALTWSLGRARRSRRAAPLPTTEGVGGP